MPAVDLEIQNRPEKRRGEKSIGMREDIKENMNPPGNGLPDRLPEHHPQEREH